MIEIRYEDSWVLELSAIPDADRVCEAGLFRSKWYDYRNMLPAQATQLFAETYIQVWKNWFAKTRDLEGAASTVPLLNEHVMKSADALAMTRARQAADQIGCKYGLYIEFAFNRAFERAWGYLPRPNQLYDEALVGDAKDFWEDLKAASLQVSENPQLLSINSDQPDLDDYHEYLIKQCRERPYPELPLNTLIYRLGHLPREVAERHFSKEVLTRLDRFRE